MLFLRGEDRGSCGWSVVTIVSCSKFPQEIDKKDTNKITLLFIGLFLKLNSYSQDMIQDGHDIPIHLACLEIMTPMAHHRKYD